MRFRAQSLRGANLPAHVSLDDVLDVAPGFFWCVDENLRFTHVSARALDVCGLEDVAHIGRRFEELGYRWEGKASPFDESLPFRKVLANRTSTEGRQLRLRLNGKPVDKAHGEFAGYIGICVALEPANEFLSLRPAEESGTGSRGDGESSETLAMFRTAVESLSDGFALFGPDGKLVFCNTSFRRLNENGGSTFGEDMTFEKIVRGNMELGLLEDAIGREEEFIAERLARHRAPSDEPRLTRWTDGNVLLVRENKLADGSTAVVNTDMTELSRREKALSDALGATEQASRAKSAFLARMSHELRTPLNAIIGFSDLVLSETFGPLGSDRYRSYVGDVKSSGEHLLSLINDLLDLTGIESGRREFSFEHQRPRDLVSTALRAVRPIGQRAGVRLRGTAPADLPDVKVDARSVHQCLLNLLSNAIKATRRGGRVLVWVDQRRDGSVSFAVIDTGKGMSKGFVHRLLRNSGPMGASYVAETDGTGLGLAITKSLVEIMGGHLEIESVVAVGTRVSMILPAA